MQLEEGVGKHAVRKYKKKTISVKIAMTDRDATVRQNLRGRRHY